MECLLSNQPFAIALEKCEDLGDAGVGPSWAIMDLIGKGRHIRTVPVPDWVKEADPARSDSLYREAWSRLANVVGKRELPRLDREVPGLNYRIPTPGLKAEGGAVYSNAELPGFTLRYTTDGSEPTVQSPEVRGPIPFRGTVRVAAFNTTGRKGHTARVGS